MATPAAYGGGTLGAWGLAHQREHYRPQDLIAQENSQASDFDGKIEAEQRRQREWKALEENS